MGKHQQQQRQKETEAETEEAKRKEIGKTLGKENDYKLKSRNCVTSGMYIAKEKAGNVWRCNVARYNIVWMR
jgi:hypothetical protein